MTQALQRITKWRRVFMSWQLGARRKGDPEADAVVDNNEVRILLRVEVSALAALLIQKGVFTLTEFQAQLDVEAELLELAYQQKFPGHRADDSGIVLDMPEALTTRSLLGLDRTQKP